jgi:hypothetical protein
MIIIIRVFSFFLFIYHVLLNKFKMFFAQVEIININEQDFDFDLF